MIDTKREKLVTYEQAAAIVSCTEEQLDDWVAEGLETVTRSSAVFTSREALHRFVHQLGPAPEVSVAHVVVSVSGQESALVLPQRPIVPSPPPLPPPTLENVFRVPRKTNRRTTRVQASLLGLPVAEGVSE